MELKKIVFVIAAMALFCTPAFAGDQPEYDAVYCDSTNIFMGPAQLIVCRGNVVGSDRINEYSNFATSDCCLNPAFWPGLGWTCDPLYNPDPQPCESFISDASGPSPDVCFGNCNDRDGDGNTYQSYMGTVFNGHFWKYRIVLQKKPQTDLDINIYDCVVKPNSGTMFGDTFNGGAEQTGRYGGFTNPGSFWLQLANPTITVRALRAVPPPTPGIESFRMEGRQQPGLQPICLENQLYTSKGPWDESIVVKMPLTGITNFCGDVEFRLDSGDVIEVTLATTDDSTARIRYGEDNVMVKYVAIHGTEYTTGAAECLDCAFTQGCVPFP
jgi:hypothetical protein